jgi:selenide,water dikinase
MARLNRAACEILGRRRVVACTDVTGFGLAGHAAEMASGGPCGLRIRFGSLPFLPEVARYASMGLVPEGTWRNKEGRMRAVKIAGALGPAELDLLFDPQTSGGLLAAVAAEDAESALADLRGAGVDAAIIGEAGGPSGCVEILD